MDSNVLKLNLKKI